MGFYVTGSECERREKTHPPSKNRVWDFFATFHTCAGQNIASAQYPRPENEPTPTATASGARYYGYRFYSPQLGRWISRDPIEEEGGINVFAFVLNGPIDEIDPDGLSISDYFSRIKQWARQQWFDSAVKYGNLPPGLPRELLRQYIWEVETDFSLSADRFVNEVRPRGSVYSPNASGASLPEALKADLRTKCSSSGAKFTGNYRFVAFDSGHRTGGLGRFIMNAYVDICCMSPTAWELKGTAQLIPEKWDFDWKLWPLIKEQYLKSVHRLPWRYGRETRTFLGSFIPGKPFLVRAAPVNIYEKSGDNFATFSK